MYESLKTCENYETIDFSTLEGTLKPSNNCQIKHARLFECTGILNCAIRQEGS